MLNRIATYAGTEARYALARFRNPKAFALCGVTVPLGATPQLQYVKRSVYRGDYERPEMDALATLLREDDVVLEMGGGLGVVSTFIAQRLTTGRLTVVEANPALISSIEATFAANGVKAELIQAAVGTSDGTVQFYFDDSFLSSSNVDRNRGITPTTVQTVAFTRLVAERRPSVIVFDIEGAEREIFALPLPSYVRLVCGEMHPHVIGDTAVSEIISSLLNQGFILRVDQSVGRAFAFDRVLS